MNKKNITAAIAVCAALLLPATAAAKSKTVTYVGGLNDGGTPGMMQLEVSFKKDKPKKVLAAYAADYNTVCRQPGSTFNSSGSFAWDKATTASQDAPPPAAVNKKGKFKYTYVQLETGLKSWIKGTVTKKKVEGTFQEKNRYLIPPGPPYTTGSCDSYEQSFSAVKGGTPFYPRSTGAISLGPLRPASGT